jgi:hypothetical protein
VFGIFQNAAQAERTVDQLLAADFRKNTKAPERTATGVAAGGAIGGTLGLLAWIGALAIPGIGPFVAAGPIMGALAGLGVGGAVGGLIGALV